MRIYIIYEEDGSKTLDSIIIKYITTNRIKALTFFKQHNTAYLSPNEEYNFVLALYIGKLEELSDKSDARRNLRTLKTTEQ